MNDVEKLEITKLQHELEDKIDEPVYFSSVVRYWVETLNADCERFITAEKALQLIKKNRAIADKTIQAVLCAEDFSDRAEWANLCEKLGLMPNDSDQEPCSITLKILDVS